MEGALLVSRDACPIKQMAYNGNKMLINSAVKTRRSNRELWGLILATLLSGCFVGLSMNTLKELSFTPGIATSQPPVHSTVFYFSVGLIIAGFGNILAGLFSWRSAIQITVLLAFLQVMLHFFWLLGY